MTGQQLTRLRNAVDKYRDSISAARKELANSVGILCSQLRYEQKGGFESKGTGKGRSQRLQDEIAILYELFDELCLQTPYLGFEPDKLYADLTNCRKENEEDKR